MTRAGFSAKINPTMNPSIGEESLKLHRALRGKIEVMSKTPVRSAADLSLVYTPGVGAVSTYLAAHKDEIRELTIKGNTVAVVSDGSAVLGLGNIGPEGALPVMEGKAVLFKTLAGINAFPIVLATQDVEEIIMTVKNIAPVFGGINLEDISAPRCFEIERRLKAELDIPVMHDDQHGTAVVVLAGLTNAAKVAGKEFSKMRIAILGAGAAGQAIARLLIKAGVGDIILLDRQGIISKNRAGLDQYKAEMAALTNQGGLSGGLSEALRGADALIGVSGPNLVKPEQIKLMAAHPIVFALANPVSEIMPEAAKAGGAYIVATGRSDFPNQLNNSLCFPGIFKGALECRVRAITDEMKLAAARALAAVVAEPTVEKIIPAALDPAVVEAVAGAIR